MRIGRDLHSRRKLLGLSLLGGLMLTVGCGESANSGGPPTGEDKAKQDADRAAREKAYGSGGVPGGKKTPKK